MERKNGAFRKRKESFAMVSNHILRDDSVSLRSKGLFALIQSYVTLENFTIYKSFLQSKCMEGEKAFNRAWEELNGFPRHSGNTVSKIRPAAAIACARIIDAR